MKIAWEIAKVAVFSSGQWAERRGDTDTRGTQNSLVGRSLPLPPAAKLLRSIAFLGAEAV